MSAEPHTLVIESPGALTTVQDLGRPGWQAQGVTPGGAADRQALRVGNLLLGNPEGTAALECTLTGPRLRFARDTWVCLTGAGVAERPFWRPWLARAGESLALDRLARGARLYVCVAGGIAVAPVLGSRSTHLGAGFGGWRGRPLKRGDVLPLVDDGRDRSRLGSMAPAPDMVPAYAPRVRVRVMPGPQWDWFSPEARERFLGTEWRVRAASDRMGLRLDGTPVQRSHTRELVSEAVALGSIQVPPDGRPILLLVDRQTLGGYPKIATLVAADRPLAAQLRPGDHLRCDLVTRSVAEQLRAQRERAISRLRAGMGVL